jgi:hypothetical protein
VSDATSRHEVGVGASAETSSACVVGWRGGCGGVGFGVVARRSVGRRVWVLAALVEPNGGELRPGECRG